VPPKSLQPGPALLVTDLVAVTRMPAVGVVLETKALVVDRLGIDDVDAVVAVRSLDAVLQLGSAEAGVEES
jgi:hypothetical protein